MKLGMKGKEGMSKESDAWSTDLQNIVSSHLKLAGVALLDAPSSADGGASADELNQVLLQVQGKNADGISSTIDKKPEAQWEVAVHARRRCCATALHCDGQRLGSGVRGRSRPG